MFPLVLCWGALVLSGDAGRVEVEGLVVTAVARPSPFPTARPDEGVLYEVEVSVAAKGGGPRPLLQLVGPFQVVGNNKELLATRSRSGPEITREPDRDRWTVRLAFEEPPPKTLPAVEGAITVATPQWKTATFEGDKFKPNAILPIEGGTAKLIVFDPEDGVLDVRFRVTLPVAMLRESTMSGGRATLIDARGKELQLGSSGGGYGSDGATTEHHLRFRGETASMAPPRALRLEVPAMKEPAKKVRLRIPDVPVEETRAKRRAGR